MKKYYILMVLVFSYQFAITQSTDTAISSKYTTDQEVSELLAKAEAEVNGPVLLLGDQIWSTNNLNVSCYSNGDPIPEVRNKKKWSKLTSGAWCWYNNDSAKYASIYGKLYNWYAVNDPRGLAPEGWHVPSGDEWNELIKFLDPEADTSSRFAHPQSCLAGGSMRNISGWKIPELCVTNLSGFSAMPAGHRYNNGKFFSKEHTCSWWSSEELRTMKELHTEYAWTRALGIYGFGLCGTCITNGTCIYKWYDSKNAGNSVRIIRD